MGDEVTLVLEAAVELGAVGLFEIAREIEAVEDADRISWGLEVQRKRRAPASLSALQRSWRAVVDDRLEQTPSDA